jgi:hypothetical protein
MDNKVLITSKEDKNGDHAHEICRRIAKRIVPLIIYNRNYQLPEKVTPNRFNKYHNEEQAKSNPQRLASHKWGQIAPTETKNAQKSHQPKSLQHPT